MDRSIHNVPLSSSFAWLPSREVIARSRQNPVLKDEMIDTILFFLPSIPGNVIAFFPSYGFLNDCWYAWERGGQLNSVRAVKEVFKEESGMGNDDFNAIVKSLKRASYGRGAVCRGKASEGIDFSDSMCRCVMITGVPYPPFTDRKVQMRRQYLDEKAKQQDIYNERARAALAAGQRSIPRYYPDLPLASVAGMQARTVSGGEWYAISAHRAVNQSVGRAIRHKGDYGLILLMDERFASASSVEHLSKWMQPFYREMKDPRSLLRDVEDFFALNNKQNPGPKKEERVLDEVPTFHSFAERLKVSQEERVKEAPKANLNTGLWKKLRASKEKVEGLSQEMPEKKKITGARSIDSDSDEEAISKRLQEKKEQFCSRLKKELKPAPEMHTPPAKGIKRFFHSEEVKKPRQSESGVLTFSPSPSPSPSPSVKRNLFGVKRKSWRVCEKNDNDVIRTRAGKSH